MVKTWEESAQAMKTMNITDILTEDEIKVAYKIWKERQPRFAQTIEAALIRPNLPRIEQHLGQQMDPGYLAYAVEFVFMQAERQA
jgi:hypothetical protein